MGESTSAGRRTYRMVNGPLENNRGRSYHHSLEVGAGVQ